MKERKINKRKFIVKVSKKQLRIMKESKKIYLDVI
jgi:hypothetical protein